MLEDYIALGEEDDLEQVAQFLRNMVARCCRENMLNHTSCWTVLTKKQCLESRRLPGNNFQWRCTNSREAVTPVISTLLDHEDMEEEFNCTVKDFVERVVARAVEKRNAMDAERLEAEAGHGGLAFEAQNMEAMQEAAESPEENAKQESKTKKRGGKNKCRVAAIPSGYS